MLAALALLVPTAHAPAAQLPPPMIPMAAIMDQEWTANNNMWTFGKMMVNFNPTGKMEMVITGPDGSEVVRKSCERQTWDNFPVVDKLQINGVAFLPQAVGTYTMTFTHDGVPITQYKYELKRGGNSGDPYAAAGPLHRDGMWRTHAYLAHDVAQAKGPLTFYYWSDIKESESERGVYTQSIVLHGGKPVAQAKQPGYHEVGDSWSLGIMELVKPDGSPLTLQEMESKGGRWEFVVKHGSKRDEFPTRVKSFSMDCTGGAVKLLPENSPTHEPLHERLGDVKVRYHKNSINFFPYMRTYWMKSS